ncbi:uncharacterized protein EV420DRAFT_1281686, partial [Desarmillaria tabescens]
LLEMYKNDLEEDHPITLLAMSNLASTYQNQGQWKEAEELELQVLSARKLVSGKDHPMTLLAMSNLAPTYRNQGRWKEAEEPELLISLANYKDQL